MNWDRLEGQWKQERGKGLHHWGRIMNDELSSILGKYEELVGRLQEKYGIAKAEANERADDHKKIIEQLKESNVELMKLRKMLGKKKLTKTTMKTKTPSGEKTVGNKSRRLAR